MAGARDGADETDAALAAAGLRIERDDTPQPSRATPPQPYPDNEQSVEVFRAMSTQWRESMAGRSGLDYTPLPCVMGLLGVKRKRRRDVFEDVRTMERAVLEAWAERRPHA